MPKYETVDHTITKIQTQESSKTYVIQMSFTLIIKQLGIQMPNIQIIFSLNKGMSPTYLLAVLEYDRTFDEYVLCKVSSKQML